jgi:uncharacterized protein
VIIRSSRFRAADDRRSGIEMAGESPRRPGHRVFLSAQWRDLVMLNYEVDAHLLESYVPPGTQLDTFDGRAFVSLVGFRFLETKLFGFAAVPFHVNFDEVNLRFYVRRSKNGEISRGVVFIREVVPRAAIALVARIAYGERYSCHLMRHSVHLSPMGGSARYQWRLAGAWCEMEAHVSGAPAQTAEGSLAQFITEHYWGYVPRRDGCLEYQVSHPAWRVWTAHAAHFRGDADSLYGPQLAAVVRRPPDSAFVADGSPVVVFRPRRVAERGGDDQWAPPALWI